MVHSKETHTIINVQEKSNHPCMKKGIIKGFADKARAPCDQEHLDCVLENIEHIFVANGYKRERVRKYMEVE